jgi:hypothetical protein
MILTSYGEIMHGFLLESMVNINRTISQSILKFTLKVGKENGKIGHDVDCTLDQENYKILRM